MARKRWATIAALSTAAAVAACSSKLDANERNFAAALERHFAERGHQCLGTVTWPMDIAGGDGRVVVAAYDSEAAARMAALQKAGLVEAVEMEVHDRHSKDKAGKADGKRTITRYTPSEAAKQYLREGRVHAAFASTGAKPVDLCWGRKSVERVVKWEGPIKLGDYQAATVTYTYKMVDIAPWAHRRDIQEAFESVKKTLDGIGTEQIRRGMQLTSEGWEVKRSFVD